MTYTVTQADRDAVQRFHAAILARLAADIENENEKPTLGEEVGDDGDLVQQFARHRIETIAALRANPPKHEYWMPGEPDCPREIKASNGELTRLRCKHCGEGGGSSICFGALLGEG